MSDKIMTYEDRIIEINDDFINQCYSNIEKYGDKTITIERFYGGFMVITKSETRGIDIKNIADILMIKVNYPEYVEEKLKNNNYSYIMWNESDNDKYISKLNELGYDIIIIFSYHSDMKICHIIIDTYMPNIKDDTVYI
jgi:hypothetical protein